MAITKSAKKAAKRSKVLEARNKDFKIRMNMHIKKLLKKTEQWEAVLPEELNAVYKYIDKALKVWIIKKKTAGRKKSRVARAVNSLNKQS